MILECTMDQTYYLLSLSIVSLMYCYYEKYNIPYSGKLSREKTFAFRSKTRISRRKLSLIAPVQLLCRCGPHACATHPHTCNVHIADCKI